VQGGLSIANVRHIKGDRYKKLISQGGATAGWVGETETRTSTSTPTLSEIEIVPGELYVNAPASQQILDDGDVEAGCATR
jgi:HK97 family phage major capsid protein